MARAVDASLASGKPLDAYRTLSQSWPWPNWQGIATLQSFYWLISTGRYREVVEIVDSLPERQFVHLSYFKALAHGSQSVPFPWFFRGRISRPAPALIASMRGSHPVMVAVASALEYDMTGDGAHLDRIRNLGDFLLPGMPSYFVAMAMRGRHSHAEVRSAFDRALQESPGDCRVWQAYLTWEFRSDPSLSSDARAGLALCQSSFGVTSPLCQFFAYADWVDNRRDQAIERLKEAYDADRCTVTTPEAIAIYLGQLGDKAGAKKWQREAQRAKSQFTDIADQLASRETWQLAKSESKV